MRLTLLASALMFSGASLAGAWNIGILAMRGEVSTRNHWQALETQLNQQIPGERFHIPKKLFSHAAGLSTIRP